MRREELDLQALNQRVQLDDEWRLLGQAQVKTRAREVAVSDREERVTIREVNVTSGEAKLRAAENANARRKQTGKSLVTFGVALCLTGFSLLYITLVQDAKRAEQRRQLHLAEMRELERWR